MSAKSIDTLINEIGNLSVFDLAELVKSLEERFGVSAAMPAAAAAPSSAPTAAAAKAEEKAEYKLELLDGGDQKIKVIKAVKAMTKLGLTEAKKLVDEAPSVLLESVPTAEAKAMKDELEAAGAKVKLS